MDLPDSGSILLNSTLLGSVWLGTPLWLWLGFAVVIVVLLALDLLVFHRGDRQAGLEIGVRESLGFSAFYILLGLGFGGLVWWRMGQEPGLQYLTGFLLEKSLAIDNLFVIAMIFTHFAIPRRYQHRVLFWGILGAILMRAVMIGLGAALVARWAWVLDLFALFLIFTGIRMWRGLGDGPPDIAASPLLRWLRRHLPVTRKLHGNRFFVRLGRGGRPVLAATPLFLALTMVEFADILFAVDSVPAVFAVSTDPFIVYTSNIFAILGLRSLYFALAASLARFHYLQHALAMLLLFIGGKILAGGLLPGGHVPAWITLAATVLILGGGVALSLLRERAAPEAGGKDQETGPSSAR